MLKTGKSGQEQVARIFRIESVGQNLGGKYPHMMTCISDLGPVYSIYLDNEGLTEVPSPLKDIDAFTRLDLPRNSIRMFPMELGQCKRLERIILDWNQIDMMDTGIFSDKSFGNLEVLSIAHNRSKFCKLPDDFGMTKRPNRIKHIDLQDNAIKDVPNSILECVNLEFLDMSHNKIVRLPAQLGKNCSKLKKIFMSFNPLVELPETIGECSMMSHIRVVDCRLVRLPDSILKLWQQGDHNGQLETLEVTKNPLIMPPSTAFDMGAGHDQAFRILQQHVKFEQSHKHKHRPVAIANEPSGDLAKQVEAVKAIATPAPASNNEDDMVPGMEYYFKHCTGTERTAKINEIRNAESALLIIKCNMYFENQRQAAIAARDSMGEANVPKSLSRFLDKNFDVSQWHEKVHVTDLDLYFNLLVYSTKPMFSSAAILFDRFETEDKGYLNREEWNELCLCVPILLDDPAICTAMWNLMSWRTPDRIYEKDFVAAWHIHDVEHEDPWIKQMTNVLQLEYYDMTIEELRARLKAKDSEDATPQLDFDEDPNKSDSDSDLAEREASGLPRLEGERRFQDPGGNSPKGDRSNKGAQNTTNISNLISLTEKEYAMELQGEQQDNSDSDVSMKSDQLSEDGESVASDDEFPVGLVQRSVGAVTEGENGNGAFYVASDGDIDKLMWMEAKDFFKSTEKHNAPGAKAIADGPGKVTKKNRGKKPASHDNHFRTDVFQVRQEIRQVYRNLPHDDFVKMISFLLRGMQMIAHSRAGSVTYWHADDPTFKFTMGALSSNPYTRQLLKTMGFAFLMDLLYWVWPEIHMSEVNRITQKKVPVWGAEEVPKNCNGLKEDRLNDMILLLKKCQKALHKKGKKFNGNFS